jgi:hypothetical protein
MGILGYSKGVDIMRKLTDNDMMDVVGSVNNGYRVECARHKRERSSDSDNYGVVLAKNNNEHYVTWQFHLDGNDKPNMYWGHYFNENREAAVRDFNNRDQTVSRDEMQEMQEQSTFGIYEVTITETLQMVVTVEADSIEDAEQAVSDSWHNGDYILDADSFVGVGFTVCEYSANDS